MLIKRQFSTIPDHCEKREEEFQQSRHSHVVKQPSIEHLFNQRLVDDRLRESGLIIQLGLQFGLDKRGFTLHGSVSITFPPTHTCVHMTDM